MSRGRTEELLLRQKEGKVRVRDAAIHVLQEAGEPLHAKEITGRINVQAPVVQQVRGSLGTHEQGLIITTSDFSPGARREAARPDATPVALMNGEQLVVLLVEHSIGVTRRSHDLFELEEEEIL